MSKPKIHIFKSEEHFATNPIDDYNRIVFPKAQKYIFPYLDQQGGEAYLFGQYTTRNLESQRFDKTEVGKPYFRAIGLIGGNWPKELHGKAASAYWNQAYILPKKDKALEKMIAELLSERPYIPNSDQPIISWVYQKFIPAVEKASEESGLWIIRHYKA